MNLSGDSCALRTESTPFGPSHLTAIDKARKQVGSPGGVNRSPSAIVPSCCGLLYGYVMTVFWVVGGRGDGGMGCTENRRIVEDHIYGEE